MKYRIRQRFFSWLDRYDIYDEDGNTAFTVKGKFAIGHCLHILNADGEHIATVREKIFTIFPKFKFYINDEYQGMLRRKFKLFLPEYVLDYKDWTVKGDFLQWDYDIVDSDENEVAEISKEIFHLTDTYVIDAVQEEDALEALMVVIAIDAEKCTRKRRERREDNKQKRPASIADSHDFTSF